MTGLAEALPGALRDGGQWVAGVAVEVGAASWMAGVGVAAAGLLVLLAGARFRRPVAIVGSAVLSALAVHLLALRGLPMAGVPTPMASVLAAAAGAAVSLALPQLFPALAGALPLALLGDLLAPEGYRLAFAAGGAVLGVAAGLLLVRLVAATVAAVAGALAVTIGVVGVLRGTGVGRVLVAHPVAILAAAAILAVAGTAFQYATAWGRGAHAAGKLTGKGA